MYKRQISHQIIGSNKIALEAFKKHLEQKHIEVLTHGSELTGYAKSVGESFVKEASLQKVEKATAHIFGGETIVDLNTDAPGRLGGGRNQRIVLSAINKLELENVIFFSFATDGEDGRGPKAVAGAISGPSLFEKSRQLEFEPSYYLDRCDEYAFFEDVSCEQTVGGHIVTGLTGTNVCDIMGYLVFPERN